MRFLVALAVLGVLGSGPASAQHQLVLDKLNELNAKAPQPTGPELQKTVTETAKAYSDAKKTCAPSGLKIDGVAPITGAKGIMQGVLSGQLRNAWTLYAEHLGCKEANPFRYMVLQRADGSLQAVVVNTGRTFANPSIMRDTSGSAAMAAFQKARALDASCDGKDMKMGPTKVVSQSADLGREIYGVRYAGNWTESWQFETCGRKFNVPIDFVPDGDGGAFTNIKTEAVAVVP